MCGEQKKQETPSQPPQVLALGVYYTAINVRNSTHKEATYRKRVALAKLGPGENPGLLSAWTDERELLADKAMEIDCDDIRTHIDSTSESEAKFLKGFVVIKSLSELDVVAVYTAAGKDGYVATIHTERVAPRRLNETWPDE